jgi:DnaJ-class molecular chaperone
MNKSINPYEILGINSSATEVEIKKAYRDLARKAHPDKGGTEERFKQINEAYTQIIKGDPIEEFPELDEIFRRGPTIRTKLELTLEQLETGGKFSVKYKRNVPTGKFANSVSSTPFGVMVIQIPEEIEKTFETIIDVPKCYDHRKPLVFTRFARADSLPPGDLEVFIQLIKHPVFTKVSGTLDLQTELEISLKEALTGFDREIKLLNSEETVKIECRSIVNPYDIKRIKHYGMQFDDEIYGDLLIKFRIIFPILLPEDTIDVIKDLKDL